MIRRLWQPRKITFGSSGMLDNGRDLSYFSVQTPTIPSFLSDWLFFMRTLFYHALLVLAPLSATWYDTIPRQIEKRIPIHATTAYNFSTSLYQSPRANCVHIQVVQHTSSSMSLRCAQNDLKSSGSSGLPQMTFNSSKFAAPSSRTASTPSKPDKSWFYVFDCS